MEISSLEKKLFTFYKEIYSQHYFHAGDWEKERIRAFICAKYGRVGHYEFLSANVEKNASVLDIGSGNGHNALYLAKNGDNEVVGIQPSGVFAKFASNQAKKQKLATKVSFVIGVAQRLPFKEGAFRCAICIEVLEHIPNKTPALKEISRVTKNGFAIIRVPLQRVFDFSKESKIWETFRYGRRNLTMYHLKFGMSELIELLSKYFGILNVQLVEPLSSLFFMINNARHPALVRIGSSIEHICCGKWLQKLFLLFPVGGSVFVLCSNQLSQKPEFLGFCN